MAKKYTRQVPPTKGLNKGALPGLSYILHIEAPSDIEDFERYKEELAAAIGPWGGSHLEILAHYAGKCAKYLNKKKIKPEGTAYVTANKVYRRCKPDAEKILHEIPYFPESPPTDGATPETMAVRAIGFFLTAIEGCQAENMDIAVRNSLGAMDAYWRFLFAEKYEPLAVAAAKNAKESITGGSAENPTHQSMLTWLSEQIEGKPIKKRKDGHVMKGTNKATVDELERPALDYRRKTLKCGLWGEDDTEKSRAWLERYLPAVIKQNISEQKNTLPP